MSSDSILFYSNVVALLALVSLLAAVELTVYRLVKGPDAARILQGRAIWLAWLVALVATLGSLFYSEVIGFPPCRLCWFQRIAMYPMAVVLLVGAIRREFQVKYYALPLAVIGFAISVYHVFVQWFPTLEGTSCDPNNPCSNKFVEIFGFVTIPFMAGAGFILITVLLGFYVNQTAIPKETGRQV
ncbi:MAG: disulfide oxidoreductase [Acidimicrobiia bacterium]